MKNNIRWSWRLLTVAGIGIYVHVTFLLLLAWWAGEGYLLRHRWADAWTGVAFILALFVVIVLHELGHAMMARRFGIATRDITLLPIGGLARLERMPEDPKQELAVALAGPAVNVLLALLLFAGLSMGSQLAGPEQLARVGGNFFEKLMWANVAIALFNLLPAFPMDGGRVLRAMLAVRMDYVRATRIAARIGQGMAALFAVIGLWWWNNPVLVLVAMFVWFAAAQEASMVQMKSALNTLPVNRVMMTDFQSLRPDDPLSRAVELMLRGSQQDFPVCNESRLAGLLTRAALLNGLARLDQNMPVADAMEKEFPTADPDETAEAAFMRLQQSGCRSMPVVRDGELRGVLTGENVRVFLMVQAALNREAAAPHASGQLRERPAA